MEVAKKFFPKKIEPNKFDSILYYTIYIICAFRNLDLLQN